MTEERTPDQIKQAIHGQRAAIERAAQQGLIDPNRAADVIKGIELALFVIFPEQPEPTPAKPRSMDLEHLRGGVKIVQLTYCRDMAILEAQMADGTVRHHRGVDSNTWYRVQHDEDGETGYYNYVWDKYPYTEQRP